MHPNSSIPIAYSIIVIAATIICYIKTVLLYIAEGVARPLHPSIRNSGRRHNDFHAVFDRE